MGLLDWLDSIQLQMPQLNKEDGIYFCIFRREKMELNIKYGIKVRKCACERRTGYIVLDLIVVVI